MCSLFFFSSRRRHTRCALVTGVQTCALPISASAVRHIQILGRRGPHQIAMTPKELGELGHLERASARVDPADLPPEGDDAMLEPGMRKSVTHLRSFAANPVAKPVTIDFDFFAMPVRSEEHTSELQSIMRLSSAVFCLIK